MLQTYLSFPLNFLKKAAKTFPPLTFSMEHLLHRLYGVDAPGARKNCVVLYYTILLLEVNISM